jgi:hypothetical protein
MANYSAQEELGRLPSLCLQRFNSLWRMRERPAGVDAWWGRPDLNRGSQAPEASSSSMI